MIRHACRPSVVGAAQVLLAALDQALGQALDPRSEASLNCWCRVQVRSDGQEIGRALVLTTLQISSQSPPMNYGNEL